MLISPPLSARSCTRFNPSRGYTLLELLFVIGIVGFLAVMTVPSFSETIRRNSREGAMLRLTSAISLARSEAVSQARNVAICRSANQSTCTGGTGGTDWDAGWIIFTDAGTVGTKDGSDVLLQVQGAGNAAVVIKLRARSGTPGHITGDYLRFDEEGFLANTTTGAYFKFCDTKNDLTNARALLLSNTGRPSMSTTGLDAVYNDLAGNNLVCP